MFVAECVVGNDAICAFRYARWAKQGLCERFLGVRRWRENGAPKQANGYLGVAPLDDW